MYRIPSPLPRPTFVPLSLPLPSTPARPPSYISPRVLFVPGRNNSAELFVRHDSIRAFLSYLISDLTSPPRPGTRAYASWSPGNQHTGDKIVSLEAASGRHAPCVPLHRDENSPRRVSLPRTVPPPPSPPESLILSVLIAYLGYQTIRFHLIRAPLSG